MKKNTRPAPAEQPHSDDWWASIDFAHLQAIAGSQHDFPERARAITEYDRRMAERAKEEAKLTRPGRALQGSYPDIKATDEWWAECSDEYVKDIWMYHPDGPIRQRAREEMERRAKATPADPAPVAYSDEWWATQTDSYLAAVSKGRASKLYRDRAAQEIERRAVAATPAATPGPESYSQEWWDSRSDDFLKGMAENNPMRSLRNLASEQLARREATKESPGMTEENWSMISDEELLELRASTSLDVRALAREEIQRRANAAAVVPPMEMISADTAQFVELVAPQSSYDKALGFAQRAKARLDAETNADPSVLLAAAGTFLQLARLDADRAAAARSEKVREANSIVAARLQRARGGMEKIDSLITPLIDQINSADSQIGESREDIARRALDFEQLLSVLESICAIIREN